MKDNRLSKYELFLLITMLFSYAAALYFLLSYFFLSHNRLFLLLFFILHGCLAVAFFLMSHAGYTRSLLDRDISSIQAVEERKLFEQNASTISRLKKEMDELLSEKDRLNSDNVEIRQKNEELARLLSEKEACPEPGPGRGSSGLLPPGENPVELDLIATVQDIIDRTAPYARSCGISLYLSTSCSELEINADAVCIRTMFENVINNSLKHMNCSGSLVITVSNIGNQVLIVLKDNGQGIPSHELERIFDLNYRGTNAAAGNGLGLAQVKAIVEHYGGTVYAKSDSGMAVYIQLPARLH